MIFVTVGSSKYPFRRLLETMDKLASKLGVEVMMQIGYNNYKPSFCNYVDFLSQEEFESMISKAKIVVCPGGLGTIITAIKIGKPIIVFPRLKKYREILREDALWLIELLKKEGLIHVAFNESELENAIMLLLHQKDKDTDIKQRQSSKDALIEFIKRLISSWKNESKNKS